MPADFRTHDIVLDMNVAMAISTGTCKVAGVIEPVKLWTTHQEMLLSKEVCCILTYVSQDE